MFQYRQVLVRLRQGDTEWSVVYVEMPRLQRLSEKQRNRRIDLLRLAESLGAETVTLDGPTAAATLVEYAATRNATRIVVGTPKRRGWRALWRRSTAMELQRHTREFDLITVAPREERRSSVDRSAHTPVTELRQPLHLDRTCGLPRLPRCVPASPG